jgi:hypothetical protein
VHGFLQGRVSTGHGRTDQGVFSNDSHLTRV